MEFPYHHIHEMSMSSNEEEISNNTYKRNGGMNSNYDIISYQKHILHSDIFPYDDIFWSAL